MTDLTVEKDEGAVRQPEVPLYIPGKPFVRLRRELSDDDLANPAVQKLILSEIDKLELNVESLKGFENAYHKLDKENAVLKENLRSKTAFEILYGFCLSLGACIIGLASWSVFASYLWIPILVGGVMFIGAIISKILK